MKAATVPTSMLTRRNRDTLDELHLRTREVRESVHTLKSK